ncbi:MAG: enoyl-CoA hydratase/isomerase family protein [Ectothiorhodospiraceae bacterium AqS1]|nr:enoyl-CoA hydratase/isomerase family protein [Ectothiorhodospiraceae bacterium AqS1]
MNASIESSAPSSAGGGSVAADDLPSAPAPVAVPLSTDRIIADKAQGVGRLRLNQPNKRNAISYSMWLGIVEAMKAFEEDPDVRTVVMSGEGGRAFSAGADISEFQKNRSTADQIEVYNHATHIAYQTIARFPKPVIARIEGFCVGGGMAVALCADLRIATDDSTFGIPAAKLGLGYSHEHLQMLVDIVGPSFAKEILFTAKRFSAAEAQGMGLVNRVVARGEIEAFTFEYAQTIADNAPLTVRSCKTSISELMKDPDERDLLLCREMVDACFASEDYKEGRSAFVEKRRPRFRGC